MYDGALRGGETAWGFGSSGACLQSRNVAVAGGMSLHAAETGECFGGIMNVRRGRQLGRMR